MAQLVMIGGIENVTLAYFPVGALDYNRKTFNGQFELISAIGNNVWNKTTNKPIIHCHISMGDKNYQVIGGHLIAATVAVKVEIMITIFSNEAIYYKSDETFKFSVLDI